MPTGFRRFVTFVFVACVFLAGNSSSFAQPRLIFDLRDGIDLSAVPSAGNVTRITNGYRIQSFAKSKQQWDIQLQTEMVPTPFRTGECLVWSFEARCLKSDSSDGSGSVGIYIARPNPWTLFGNQNTTNIEIEKEWKRYFVTSRCNQDFGPSEIYATLHLALRKQTLEIRDPRLEFYGNVPDAQLPFTKLTYEDGAANARWRRVADANIERFRKSLLNVKVVDSRGNAVNNVRVSIQQTKHAYAFGTYTDFMPIETGVDAEIFRDVLHDYFTRVTVPRYWTDGYGTESEWGRNASDQVAEWAKAEGFQLKHHVLIYPTLLPSRVVALRDSKQAFQREIELGIDATLARTKRFNAAVWDGLNEVRDDTIIRPTLGANFYASILNRGNAAEPNAIWFINEYGCIEKSASQVSHLNQYEDTIRSIRSNRGALEGIGFQSHFVDRLTPITEVLSILDRFSRFGLPLEVTEFDIDSRDEVTQAAYTRDFLTAVFSHPATTGFSTWGFWEGKMWRPHGAMFRSDWTPKLNGIVWQELVKEKWWTQENTCTDRFGNSSVKTFHGTHLITVTYPNGETIERTVTVAKGCPSVSIAASRYKNPSHKRKCVTPTPSGRASNFHCKERTAVDRNRRN